MHKNILRIIKPILRRLIGDHQILLEEMPDCPALFHIYRGLIASGHKRVPGGWIYEDEFYPDYLTVGGNALAIRKTALRYCKGNGLDIGAAFWPLPGSTPIDTEQGPGTANLLADVPDGSQDYVFSSHCIEHIAEWEAALDLWISKVRVGGVLFLYLPHPQCKLWLKSNPLLKGIHLWVPTFEIISDALRKRKMAIVDKDEGPDHFYSFFICGTKKE